MEAFAECGRFRVPVLPEGKTLDHGMEENNDRARDTRMKLGKEGVSGSTMVTRTHGMIGQRWETNTNVAKGSISGQLKNIPKIGPKSLKNRLFPAKSNIISRITISHNLQRFPTILPSPTYYDPHAANPYRKG